MELDIFFHNPVNRFEFDRLLTIDNHRFFVDANQNEKTHKKYNVYDYVTQGRNGSNVIITQKNSEQFIDHLAAEKLRVK